MAEADELAVLGALLLDGGMYAEVSGYLKERDFFSEQNRLIWRAMQSLTFDGKPIDLISVSNELREHTCLTKAGGSTYVSSLIDQVPDVNNVEYYAKEVKRDSASRDLVRIGNHLRDGRTSVENRMEAAFSALNDLSGQSIKSSEARIGDVLNNILAEVDSGEGQEGEIKTGFFELDKALLGFGAGDLIVVGARPSVGKSAFALQVAANVAKQNKSVLYISPEMSEAQLGRRLLSSESGVPYTSLLKPKGLSDEAKETLHRIAGTISTLPLVIDDTAQQSLADVRVKARRMQSRGGIDFLIVDYLQLLCPGDDSKEEVTKISKGLKAIAKDLSIPVMAITQLSRNLEYRDDKRPRLSDIRASGQLEQDADTVMFLWYPSKEKPIIEVFVEKNRNGALGAAQYEFDRHTTRFKPKGW